MRARNYAGIGALLMGMAAATQSAVGQFAMFQPTRSHKMVVKPAARKAGTKIARQCYQGTATMRHPDGVVAATIREAETRKRAAV